MPRYCAVKFCHNRGGSASKDNKRISFYPFPLQDEARLQKWVINMKRAQWTPSRHQYLCSEHFTEDSFDVRWGIRYLKNTAIPTIFPSLHTVIDEEKIVTTSKKSTKPKTRICDTNIQLIRSSSPPRKKPLILKREVKAESADVRTSPVSRVSESSVPTLLFAQKLLSDFDAAASLSDDTLGEALLSETQAAVCESTTPSELPGDGEILPAFCLSTVPGGGGGDGDEDEDGDEAQLQSQDADSTVTVLCCESLGPFSDSEAAVEAALQAALGQTFRILPVEPGREEPGDDAVGEGAGPTSEGEYEKVSVYEHSYSRPDTDKDQLWNRIFGLHSKIMDLDSREESTIATIKSLETEIALLKKDNVVFKEKQKVLEDYITSVLL